MSAGVVTDYTPNHRFAYEVPWPITSTAPIPAATAEWFDVTGVPLSTVYDVPPSVSPIVTESVIESVSGGSCVVRVVASAYRSGADWENEFSTEMVNGWGDMLDNLASLLDAGPALSRPERR